MRATQHKDINRTLNGTATKHEHTFKHEITITSLLLLYNCYIFPPPRFFLFLFFFFFLMSNIFSKPQWGSYILAQSSWAATLLHIHVLPLLECGRVPMYSIDVPNFRDRAGRNPLGDRNNTELQVVMVNNDFLSFL